jgi:hypothetical protein
VSKKRHLLTGVSRVFSVRVKPYSNDTGCHHLLLTRDSPTPSGAENVNLLNRIDREKKVVSKKLSFCEQKRHLLTGFIAFFSVRVIPYSNDTDCHHHLQIGDSPTPSGAKNVNLLNRIDRKKMFGAKNIIL